ncbi:MAG TPA: cytochrome c-type biogenesis protein [Zeimonas sp.]|nr:cytochrome c-type biogenesis protein [Zeimonas sp.]
MRAAATRSSRSALAALALAALFVFAGVPGSGIAADATAPAPATLAAAAPADTGMLTTPEQRARYQLLAEQLRCLVCQNQTLADSNAELAADLRRQVETMILAGRSDSEIKSFLVERYGDFVLYRPPMQQNTWLLWIGPFALLFIGALVWWRIQRRGRASDVPDLERARRLLDE